uniref:FYVE-type domain-containing protein n=1 Tax=Salix viminalis TaxID=40686 RepID=A0A6N2MPT5_SALVM
MSTEEPPPFQEAPRCDVCKCSFNTSVRHHCRCCGRTLCSEHSSNYMVLPQFGILSNVRVCADCFNDSTRSKKFESQVSVEGADSVTDKVSRLDIDAEKHPKLEPTTLQQSTLGDIECKCGMPLCICVAPTTKTDPTKPSSTFTSQSNPKPKKTDAALKNRGSTSSSKPSSVFNHGQMTNGGVDKPQMDYDINGEGLREAIKNGDTVAVKKLLSEGVDANYRDKQGMSLLHLAALFNRTDIAFILMESGASMNYKNAQGETPLDCAPATLQYKMKQKMEESGQQGPPTIV